MADLTVSLFFTLIVIVICFLFLTKRKRLDGEPPIENGWLPFIGVALQFQRNPLEFLTSRKRRYGDVFTCRIAGKYFTFILDPFSYNNVIRQGKNLNFQKFAIAASLKVFGHADFADPKYNISYEEIHPIFRQTLQGAALQPLTLSMMKNLQFVMQKSKVYDWTTEGLYSFAFKIMFEAGYLTLFGRNEYLFAEDNAEEAQEAWMTRIMDDFKVLDNAFPHIVAGIPIFLLWKVKAAREDLAGKFLHKYLKKNTNLSELIEKRINIFDRIKNLDEVNKARTHVAMLWASQANTLPATFWSLFYMLRSPEALREARKEVEQLLQDTNQSTETQVCFTKDHLDNMTVLGSIIDEALRLSSASIMIRVANENFILTLDSREEIKIRKGDCIALYPQMIHLDPEIYENPKEFKYNRFLDENGQRKTCFLKNGRKFKSFLLPFGAGTSECPGRFFAVNEIKQFLALILCHYDLELQNMDIPPLDNSRAGFGILQPKHDVQFRYKLKRKNGEKL
ncbi:cytochrome P450 7A1-like [Polypterus senegalus]|uniref:cytochrome P450 7A1-like n=1 Tax=Polypterus senegalus TaxID=55291 RepID=UPI001964F2D6|nr:cytochrome P450 7A1-like [Polypterus senegalus]